MYMMVFKPFCECFMFRLSEIKVLNRMITVKPIGECNLFPPEALMSLEPDAQGN